MVCSHMHPKRIHQTDRWPHSSFKASARDIFGSGNDVRKGLKLRDHLVFMKLGVVMQDYEATRALLKSKGASGILICLMCQNCISHRREDLNSPHLVPSDELDFTKFRKQTDKSLADSLLCC